MQKLRENWLVLSKMTGRFCQIFFRVLEKSQNWNFDRTLSSKVKNVCVKIYKGVMCHGDEEWCKIWSEIDLPFQKLTWEFWRILIQALKNLKNLHFKSLLLNKVYTAWAKSTEELCLMALKIDKKFEEKLTCAFKNDMRNLANFHRLRNSDFIF